MQLFVCVKDENRIEKITLYVLVLFFQVFCKNVNEAYECLNVQVDSLTTITYAYTDEEKRNVLLGGTQPIKSFVIDTTGNVYVFILHLSCLSKYDKSGNLLAKLHITDDIHSLSLLDQFLFAYTGDAVLKIDLTTLNVISKKTLFLPGGIISASGLTFSYGEYIFIADIEKLVKINNGNPYACIYHLPTGKIIKTSFFRPNLLPVTNYKKEEFTTLNTLLFSKKPTRYCGQSERYIIYDSIGEVSWTNRTNKMNLFVYNKKTSKTAQICDFNYNAITLHRPGFEPINDSEFVFEVHLTNEDFSNTSIFYVLKIDD